MKLSGPPYFTKLVPHHGPLGAGGPHLPIAGQQHFFCCSERDKHSRSCRDIVTEVRTATDGNKNRQRGPRVVDAPRVLTASMSLVDDGFEALLDPFYNGKKLTDPVSTAEDKFQLLPAFLKVKGGSSYFLDSCCLHLLISVQGSLNSTTGGLNLDWCLADRVTQ